MLMQPVRAPALERAGIWPFVGVWLLASAIMLIAGWHGIMRWEFPDPDDALRLQEVRDWLGGQSWFDVSQYRLNPPAGAPMHWSRLVDLPIAGMILLLRPLLGEANAELAASAIVPLITMAAVMGLVAKLTERLLDRQHALLAALLVPVSIAAMSQLRPMRIDHHGWQIALGVAAVLAALDRDRRRSGLVAGAAAALWLQISLEGLPLAATVAALFGLRWLIHSDERERLAAFMLALAGGSLLLFAITKAPPAWSAVHCDTVSMPYLALLTVGAAGTLAMVSSRIRTLPAKLCACVLLGAISLAAMLAVAPQCAAGPFEALDPLVRRFWYENVLEGLPIWRQPLGVAAAVIAFPLVGLFGTWRAWRRAEGNRRIDWAVMLFVLAASALAAMVTQRAGAVANMLALPGGVYLFELALTHARGLRPLPRLAGTIGALLLVTPAYAVGELDSLVTDAEGGPKYTMTRDCVTRDNMARLDRLPPGIIASPLDIAPSIIVYSHQRAIASGHHRNVAAMRDVIRIFTLPPDQARVLLAQRGAAYVAVCPDLIEPSLYKKEGPNGLWAEIARGRAPQWLAPVRFAEPSALHVWRVLPPA